MKRSHLALILVVLLIAIIVALPSINRAAFNYFWAEPLEKKAADVNTLNEIDSMLRAIATAMQETYDTGEESSIPITVVGEWELSENALLFTNEDFEGEVLAIDTRIILLQLNNVTVEAIMEKPSRRYLVTFKAVTDFPLIYGGSSENQIVLIKEGESIMVKFPSP